MANKTNSRIVKDRVRNYILDCISYDEETGEVLTEIEALKQLKSQLDFNKYSNRHESYNSIMQRTVSGVYKSFDYVTYEIVDVVSAWTEAPREFDTDKTYDLYLKLIGRETEILLKKHKLI